MKARVAWFGLWALLLSGCSSNPAPAPAPVNEPAAAAPTAPSAPMADTSAKSGSAPAAPDPTVTSDPAGPLRFDLTEEEKAKQAGEGPATNAGSLTDSVPEPLKKGPVGSLGRALFRGVLSGGGEDQSPSPEDKPAAPAAPDN